MHEAWHDLVLRCAAGVLTVGGSVVVALAWRARRSGRPLTEPEPAASAEPAERSVERALAAVVAALSVAASAIHFAAAPDHLIELGLPGAGFIVAGAFQASWAVAWLIDPSRTIVVLGAAANVAILAAWAWSRTVGLPVPSGIRSAEPIGLPDAIAALVEVALIALLAARALDVPSALARRLADARTVMATALVPAVGIVFLVTVIAIRALGAQLDPPAGHGLR